MAEEQNLTREQLAEIEDERKRRKALSRTGGSDSMKELNAKKKQNDAAHQKSHTILYLVGVLVMGLTLGGMAMLIMSLKS